MSDELSETLKDLAIDRLASRQWRVVSMGSARALAVTVELRATLAGIFGLDSLDDYVIILADKSALPREPDGTR